MKAVMRFIPVVPLLALALCVAGCGSSTSPTGASSEAGATIRGRVQSGSTASSADVSALSGPGKGLRVTVVGTDIRTTTNTSGSFVLQGVPGGTVTLRFEGSGVDATLRIGGLVEGQVLTIDVEVNGTRATLVAREDDDDDDDNDEGELSGRIESITPPSLRVSGRTVITNGSTRIERDDRRIGLTDLRVGERVEVEGMRQADGSILAREIEVEEEDDD